jgi:hypothetical protein
MDSTAFDTMVVFLSCRDENRPVEFMQICILQDSQRRYTIRKDIPEYLYG